MRRYFVPKVGFASATYAVMENAETVTLQVERTGDLSFALTVSYETADGVAGEHGCTHPANAGSDYVASSGTIEFAPNQKTAQVSIQIIDDDVEEEDEQFIIKLSNPVGGEAVLGEQAVTTVTIINDDFPGTFILPEEDLQALLPPPPSDSALCHHPPP